MCLGTFSRLARSLATIYIFAQVRIFGTLRNSIRSYTGICTDSLSA